MSRQVESTVYFPKRKDVRFYRLLEPVPHVLARRRVVVAS